MHEEHLEECPDCGKLALIQDHSSVSTIMEISQPKTIGDLADKNTERMISEGKLDKDRLDYDEKRKKLRKKKSRMKKIANMTPAQKDKYIMTGDEN